MRPRGRFGVTAADLEYFTRRALEVPDPDSPQPASRRRAAKRNVDLVRAFQTGFRMLSRKQFRDIVFADRACFQAIVETPIRTAGYKPKTAWTSEDYELTLEALDSAPIGRELGVPICKSDVALAFRVEFEKLLIGDKDTPATVVSNPLWNPATETASPNKYPRLPKYVERGGEAVWRSAVDVVRCPHLRVRRQSRRFAPGGDSQTLCERRGRAVQRSTTDRRSFSSPRATEWTWSCSCLSNTRVASARTRTAAWEESAIASFS